MLRARNVQRWPPTSNCTSVRRVEVHKWSILSHEINVDQRQLLHNMGYVMVCSNPDFECSWMKVKQLLREIYWACKYFLVSEVPRILHCHLSPRQMCVAASCCGCVSSQSVQKGDGPEAHSWEKNYVSSISGNCRIIFSTLSPPHSTVQHIFLFLPRLPPSPREPCRLCIRARAITPLQWCGPTLKWSFSLSTFSGDEPQPFWGHIISLVCICEWRGWAAVCVCT